MQQIPLHIQLLLLYLLAVNLLAVVLTLLDKYKAQRHKWRIKERTLLVTAAIGGSVGMYCTMQIIRHKTKKLKFMLGIPLIFLLQAAVSVAVWWLTNHWG